jgi:hypothetical protein
MYLLDILRDAGRGFIDAFGLREQYHEVYEESDGSRAAVAETLAIAFITNAIMGTALYGAVLGHFAAGSGVVGAVSTAVTVALTAVMAVGMAALSGTEVVANYHAYRHREAERDALTQPDF